MKDAVVQIDVDAADGRAAELAAAEAWDHGASGIEELEAGHGRVTLRVYVGEGEAETLRRAVSRTPNARVSVGAARPVAERDWSHAWRRGLDAVAVSARVVVRPSFVDYAAAPGQHVLVVDPGQAFGTGHHASTRLALALLDDALAALGADCSRARVLDVGTGTGVLALGAAALGAARAVGLDLDAVAAREALANAAANGLRDRVKIYAGMLDALAPARFELIVANLLRRELMPILGELARERLAPGGSAIFSGLLEGDRPEVESALADLDLCVAAERSEVDGGDRWVGLLARRAASA